MKKALLFVIALITLASCSPSKEEIAAELVKDAIVPELSYPDSYKSSYLIVDSALTSAWMNEDILNDTKDVIKLIDKIEEISKEISSLESSMRFWKSLNNDNFNQTKQKKEDQEKLLDKARDKFIALYDGIKEKDANLDKGAFCGWIIRNKFTSLSDDGQRSHPSEFLFVANKELTSCFGYEKSVFEAFQKIIDLIVTSEDVEDFVEKCQEYALTE